MGDSECEYEFDDDGMGWQGSAGDSELFERPKAKEKPQVFTQDEVLELIDTQVEDVVSVMAWSRTSALLMLKHCKWSADIVKERYFEDPEALIAASKVSDMDDSFHASDASVDCLVCWDTVEAGKAASLACSHPVCIDDWASHLTYHLKNSGTDAIAVRCPSQGCSQFCGRAAFETIFGRPSKELSKYLEYIVKSFVAANERFGECPAPNCNRFVRYTSPRSAIMEPSAPVACDCGFAFCFVCGHEDHSPASCKELAAWLKKEQDESETANWVAANTKTCPGKNCGKRVEKNGGCNHMSCPQCRYEWCWICEGPWSTHGSSWYKCNYYKEDDDKEKERMSDRDRARSELERYVHYYSRYQNHGRSRKLDKVVLQRTSRRIADELSRSTQSVIDLDYLNTTASVLNKCRHTLQYTYVYAFYLTDKKTKDLFEYNQSQLEYWTELLSEFIEDTSGRFTKQEVV